VHPWLVLLGFGRIEYVAVAGEELKVNWTAEATHHPERDKSGTLSGGQVSYAPTGLSPARIQTHYGS